MESQEKAGLETDSKTEVKKERESKGRGNQKYNLRRKTLVTRKETEERLVLPKVPKPKSRPPPLSKYRRKAANSRERGRMQEINVAFKDLQTVLPSNFLPEPESNSAHLTKITTLRLAVNYIAALRNVLGEDGSSSDHLKSKNDQVGLGTKNEEGSLTETPENENSVCVQDVEKEEHIKDPDETNELAHTDSIQGVSITNTNPTNRRRFDVYGHSIDMEHTVQHASTEQCKDDTSDSGQHEVRLYPENSRGEDHGSENSNSVVPNNQCVQGDLTGQLQSLTRKHLTGKDISDKFMDTLPTYDEALTNRNLNIHTALNDISHTSGIVLPSDCSELSFNIVDMNNNERIGDTSYVPFHGSQTNYGDFLCPPYGSTTASSTDVYRSNSTDCVTPGSSWRELHPHSSMDTSTVPSAKQVDNVHSDVISDISTLQQDEAMEVVSDLLVHPDILKAVMNTQFE